MASSGLLRGASTLFLVTVLLAGCASEEPTAGGILLVTVDGLVPEHMTLSGGPLEIPALERLAEQGAIWRDAWTAAPAIRPSVATYLTGLAPDRHMVIDDVRDQQYRGELASSDRERELVRLRAIRQPDGPQAALGSRVGIRLPRRQQHTVLLGRFRGRSGEP